MKLYHIQTGLLSVNTYLLVNENTNKAIVIDCGEFYGKIKKFADSLGVEIKTLLLTHAHFDHAGCAKKFQDTGVKVYISEVEAPKLTNDLNLASCFNKKFDAFTPDYTFNDNEQLNIEGITIKVLLTKGHTDGSATFVVEDMLFTGDTLFYESVGRTDFPTGNHAQLLQSIKRLFDLEGDYKVFPGHHDFTTLSHERKYNRLVDYD